MDVQSENTTQRLTRVHEASECVGPVCPIHRRSRHAMRGWPQYWRDDRSLMERICPKHGVGHPDPDHLTAYEARHSMDAAYGESIHGRCGCCAGRHTHQMAILGDPNPRHEPGEDRPL